jgi:hypothetical protein
LFIIIIIIIIAIATRRPRFHSHQSDAPRYIKTLDSAVLRHIIRIHITILLKKSTVLIPRNLLDTNVSAEYSASIFRVEESSTPKIVATRPSDIYQTTRRHIPGVIFSTRESTSPQLLPYIHFNNILPALPIYCSPRQFRMLFCAVQNPPFHRNLWGSPKAEATGATPCQPSEVCKFI